MKVPSPLLALVCAVLPFLCTGVKAAPIISTPPANLAVAVGSSAAFSVVAFGTGSLGYQWRRNGYPISGATGSVFALANVTQSDADIYDVVIVDGLSGATVSASARLGVAPSAYPSSLKLDTGFNLAVENGNGGTVSALVPYSDTQFMIAGDFVRVAGNTSIRRLARINSADGSLDTSFAINIGGPSSVSAVIVQPDGKVIAGGNFANANGTVVANLVRFNQDGTIDPSFASLASATILGIARQSDGKIIIAGSFTSFNGATANRVARVNTDGTIDATFLIGSTQGLSGQVNAVAIDPISGKILVGGTFTAHSDATSLNRIARLNSDGTRDTSFSVGTGFNNTVNALAFDATSNAVVGGSFTTYNGSATNAANRLVRLNATGGIDTTFATGTGANGTVNSIAYDAAGSRWLIGGGFTTYNGTSLNRIIRLSNLGALDPSFNPNSNGTVSTMFVQSNGAVVFGGAMSAVGNVHTRLLARVSSGGVRDATINIALRAGGTVNRILPVAGGKYLVAGSFSHFGSTPAANLARLNSDLTLDVTFAPAGGSGYVLSSPPTVTISGGGGSGATAAAIINPSIGTVSSLTITAAGSGYTAAPSVTISGGSGIGATAVATFAAGAVTALTLTAPATGPNNTVLSAALQGNGKILIGGSFTSFNGTTASRIARLNSDLTLDSTFNGVGTGPDNSVNDIALRPDGALYIGGSFTTVNGTARAGVARLTETGAVDPAFNAGSVAFTVLSLAVQPSDGKVLAGGSFTLVNTVTYNNVVRFNSDGTFDPAFPTTGANAGVYNVILQPDGKILISGDFTSYNGTAITRLARLHQLDGTLDPTFTIGTSLGGTIYRTVLQEDSKLLLMGAFTNQFSGVPSTRMVTRLTSTGSLDPTANLQASGSVAISSSSTAALQILDDGNVLIGQPGLTVNGIERTGLIRFTAAVAPTIASVSALSVRPDESLTITGSNFTDVSAVRFNGVTGIAAPNFTVNSPTSITATVPFGAVSGQVVVQTFAGVATSPTSLLVAPDFRLRNPQSTADTFSGGTAFGNNTYVIASSGGEIWSSPDGVDWTKRYAGPNGLYGLAFAAGQFTAVGSSGTILTSTDGLTWTLRVLLSNTGLLGIAHGGTRWVAVTTGASVATSTDGVTWSFSTSTGGGSANGVAFGAGLFVSVSALGVIRTSPDGVTWTARTANAGTNTLNDVFFLNNQFLAVGNSGTLVTSPDGLTWTARTSSSTTTLYSVAYNPTSSPAKYVVAGSATFLTSIDNGVTWTSSSLGSTTNGTAQSDLRTVVFANGQFVGGGYGGSLSTSADGSAWTIRQNILINNVRDVTFGNGRYVAVNSNANSTVAVSVDGINWTTAGNIAGTANALAGVTYGDGRYVAVGTNVILSSTDGTTWINNSPSGTFTLNGVAFGDGTFLAVGNSGVAYRSTNGVNWALVTATGTTSSLTSVAFGTAMFTAVGASGAVTTSSNLGITWTATSAGSAALNAVRFLNRRFVIVGASSTVLTSQVMLAPAALTLTPQTLPNSGANLTGVAFGDGYYVAISSNFQDTMWQSRDAVTWVPVTYSSRVAYFTGTPSLTFGNGRFIAVGSSRLILSSAPAADTPQISTQPMASSAVPTGGATSLAVTAIGASPSYQWYSGFSGDTSSLLVSATAASLTTPAITQPRNFWARFTSGTGAAAITIDSATAFVTSNSAAPIVTVHPADVSLSVGQPVSFNVTATGTGSLTYQWLRNGFAIPAATAASYSIAAASRADADAYSVAISDGFSTTVSASARLGVAPSAYPQGSRIDPNYFHVYERNLGTLNRVLVQTDGKVLVAGSFTKIDGATRTRLARFNGDGTLDTLFVPPALTINIVSLAQQADAKVLVGGDFTSVAGNAQRNRLIRLNADGSLDTTFNPTGNGPSSTVNAISVLASGQVMIGGLFTNYNNRVVNGVARLNSDGSLDPTFAPPSAGSGVYALVVQSDGKILIGGSFTTANVINRNRIARLNADGSVDPTFDPSFGPNSTVYAIALDHSGILIGGGFTTYGGAAINRIARLTSIGVLDTTFSVGTGASSTVTEIVVQPDDKILIGGAFTSYNAITTTGGNRIARLLSTGALDSSFAIGTGPNNNVNSIGLQADGRVIVGGTFATFGSAACNLGLVRVSTSGVLDSTLNPTALRLGFVSAVIPLAGGAFLLAGDFIQIDAVARPYLAKLNADGSIDPAFNVGLGPNAAVNAAYRQADGKIIIVGSFTTVNGTSASRIARLHADATLDVSFSTGGGVSGSLGGIVPQDDGKLLLFGNSVSTFTYAGAARNGLVRINLDGTTDLSFAPPPFNGAVEAVAVQRGGKLVVGGNFTTANGAPANYLARLNPDGSSDAPFNSNTGAGFNANSGGVYSVALQPADGKILVGGDFTAFNGLTRNRIARLNTDGTPDSAFDAGANVTSKVQRILLQEDGRIFVRGTFSSAGGVSTNSLGRLTAASAPDATFAYYGVSATATSAFAPVVIADDGAALIGGYTYVVSEGIENTGLVRIVPATPPTITTSPINVVSTIGGAGTFSIVASGSPPLSYQWLKDGIAVNGATQSSLAFTNVQLADVAAYSVVATNVAGAVTSSSATIVGANALPSITKSPVATAGTVGGNAALTVAATGTGTIAYQWRKYGVPISGATNATLNLSSLGLDDGGYYDVLVRDGLSMRASAAAPLAVAPSSAANTLRARVSFEPRVEVSSGLWAFAPLADGRFYAGGGFTTIDGVVVNGIARFLANGTLDPTFNAVVITGTVQAIAVQANGKIIIGGSFVTVGGLNSVRLARLNVDGSVDPAFELGSGFSGGNVSAVAIQSSDQKILVGGAFTSINGTGANYLVRLNSDGSPDATFNTGRGFDNSVNALLLQPDGAVVVGGAFSNFNGSDAARIARLTTSGTLDPTFYTGAGFDDTVYALALQSIDNKIIVGGLFTTFGGSAAAGLARLTPNGSRDAGLPLGGGFTGIGITGNLVYALAVQSDGKIAVGGNFTGYNGTPVARLARIDGVTGALDTALNTVIGTAGLNSIVRTLVVQPTTNQLLVGGSFNLVGTTPRFALVRFNLDATLDPLSRSFREPGSVLAVCPVGGGKTVIGGLFTHVGGVAIGANLARLESTGVLDASFNVGSGTNATVYAIVQQGDRRLVIGGQFTTFNGVTANRLARLSADGALDDGFNSELGLGLNNRVSAVGLDFAGRIVVGGTFTTAAGVSANRLARYGSTGAVDLAFLAANGTAFDSTVNALVVHPDGRVSVGGIFTKFGGATASRLARLQPAGGLDSEFVTGTGLALSSTNSATATITVNALALQPDGHLLAAGYFGIYNGASAEKIVRLTPSGAWDPTLAIGSGPNSTATALQLQPNGDIVVAGSFSGVNGQRRSGLVRFTSTGAIDLSFGAPFPTGVPSTTINAIVFQADGSLLVGQSGRQDFIDRLTGGLTCFENAPSPAILTPPFGGAVVAGSTSSTLTVTAAGLPPLYYQWKRDGVALVADTLNFIGTTSNTLTFINPQAAHAGVYTVTITDAANASVTSSPVTRTIIEAAPNLGNIEAAFGAVFQAGTMGYLRAAYSGSTPTAINWSKDGAPISGGFYNTGALFLPFTPVKTADAGVYQVSVANALGSVTAVPTRVWVNEEAGATPHNPAPSPQGLSHLFALNGQFQAVGIRGARIASTDGITWSQLPSLTQNNLLRFLEGNGRKLLVGTLGFFAVSSDGNAWRTSNLPTLENVQSAAFGAGLFVVSTSYSGSASGRAKIFTSPDGEVWTERYTSTSTALNTLAFGNGTFALYLGASILRSANGITWTTHPAPSTGSFISFANGQFFIVSSNFSDLHTSTDALSWETRSYRFVGARGFHYANNQYILTGDDGLLLTSPDAATWTRRTTNTTRDLRRAEYANNTWVVIGNQEYPATVLTSIDNGITWINRTTSVTYDNLQSIATDGANHLITVGTNGTILRTTNGSSWNGVTSGVTTELTRAVFGAGKYVVTGTGGQIITSPDGLTWTAVASGTTQHLRGTSFLNNQFFIAGDNGLLLRSTTGTTWTSATLPTDGGSFELAYGAGRYVAVSGGGRILTSSDAITWSEANSGTTADLRDIAFGNGKFLVSATTFVLTSSDGLAWSSAPAPEIPTGFGGAIFSNGQFFAGVGTNAFIASTDGLTWSGHHLGTNYADPNTVAAFKGRLYFAGDYGMIYSGAFAPIILQQPVAPDFAGGGPATFRVLAAGSPETVLYQWRKNGINLPSAANAALTVPFTAIMPGDSYDVVVRTSAGSVVSAAVTVPLVPGAIGTFASDLLFNRADFKNDTLAGRVAVDPTGRVYAAWTNGNTLSGVGSQHRGAVIRLSVDGSLDPAFNIGAALAEAWALTIQPDGRVLVGGVASDETIETGYALPRVFRFNADGTRDFSFNSPAFAALPRFITLQADGRLLVVPSNSGGSNGGIAVMARLKSDGSLDPSFTQPTLNAFGSIFAPPVLDADGLIYVGGPFSSINGIARLGVARLLNSGSVDATFVPSGFSFPDGQIRGLAIQIQGVNAGKLLVAGGTLTVPGSAAPSADRPVIRLLPSGAVDTTFTLVSQAAAGMSVRPRLLNALADDRFYVVGSTVTRFLADGAIDTSYARPTFSSEFFWMEALPDGRVVVPPEPDATINGNPAATLVRLTAGGAVDLSFAPGRFNREIYPAKFALLADQKILTWGPFNRSSGVPRPGLARFEANGALDLTFNVAGIPNLNYVAQAEVTPDGRILASTRLGTNPAALTSGLTRLLSSGAIDPSFTLDASLGALPGGLTFRLLPDQRVLIWSLSPQSLVSGQNQLLRLTTSGAIDPTFVLSGYTNPFGVVYRDATNAITSITLGAFKILAVDASGRVIARVTEASYPAAASTLSYTLLRFSPEGVFDPTFLAPSVARNTALGFPTVTDARTNGGAPTQIATYTADAWPFADAIPVADGKLLVFGSFSSLHGQTAPGIARLTNTGGVDPTFNPGSGAQLLNQPSRSAQIEGVTVAPDGKLWISGAFDVFNGVSARGLVRLNADGSVDPNFSTDLAYRPYLGNGTQISLAPNGTALVSGTFLRTGDLLPSAFQFLINSQTPIISSQPKPAQAVILGAATSLSVAANGLNLTYQWHKNGVLIPGATAATYLINAFAANTAGSYNVVVANAANAIRSASSLLTLNPGPTLAPATASAGSVITLSGSGFTGATGVFFNGSAATFNVVSDTQITATVPALATSGAISVLTPDGTQSSLASFTVLPGARLLNLVTLFRIGQGENAGAIGFTVEGSAPKSILLRAVGGPALTDFGVSGVLADPVLNLFDATGATIATNDNWGGGATLATAFSSAGAFALSAASLDAALLISLNPGTYSARVSGAGLSSGAALIELYEIPNATPNDTRRIAYLNSRGLISTGSTLTSGLTLGGIAGAGPTTVLIRAVSEASAATVGAGVNPSLTVFNGSTVLATNSDWGTNAHLADLAAATAAVGAAPLAPTAAALLLTLPAGNFSVAVSATGGPGLVRTEVFLVDSFLAPTAAPALLAPLLNQSIEIGSPVLFTAPVVAKPGIVSFQWKRDGLVVTGTPVLDSPGALYFPAATTGLAGNYTVLLTNSAGTTTSAPARLTITPRVHSADTDRNFQISLLELIRVIELYNVELNSFRTGAYKVDLFGEDGFSADPGRAPSAVVSLTRYHSADSNHDGKLNLFELTRVIELYNTRSGTSRTGEYRNTLPTETTTEDGFYPLIQVNQSTQFPPPSGTEDSKSP